MNVEPVFPDSNVWLYAFLSVQDKAKQRISKELIEGSNVRISVQVIGEVCNTLLRKTEITESKVAELIRDFYGRFNPVSIQSPEQLLHASDLRNRYHLSHWDSWIVVAAIDAGAKILFSEDMQDGLVVDGKLTIKNPFR